MALSSDDGFSAEWLDDLSSLVLRTKLYVHYKDFSLALDTRQSRLTVYRFWGIVESLKLLRTMLYSAYLILDRKFE